MEIIIQPDPQAGAQVAGRMVARLIRKKPNAVLGLATGSTPLGLYREIIRLHRDEGLDLSGVTTFNLDEYIGLAADHPQSYHRFMHDNFFNHINIPKQNIHIPDGMTADVPLFCREYERQIVEAGGIDMQILGIGTDGHVGFNEPTSSLTSRTRIKTLTIQTLADNARYFATPEDQPDHVITMGIGTIMESRQVVLLAFGAGKADAVERFIEGPVSSMMPASVLQFHTQAHVFLDDAAASRLIRADYYRWVYKNKPDWQLH